MKNKYQEALDEVMNNLDSLKDSYVKKRLKVLQELVDKETPKKPVLAEDEKVFFESIYDDDGYLIASRCACPNCKKQWTIYDGEYNRKFNRCNWCGQMIDWGDDEYEQEKE